MKRLKKTLIGLTLFFAVTVGLLYAFNLDYLLTAIRTVYLTGHTTAYLDDYKKFDNRMLPASKQPQPWAYAQDYNSIKPTQTLEQWHQKLGSVAFLIIKNDSLWNESYYDHYTKDTPSNSFSMAKSIVSASLGKAIMQGKIRSLDQKVSDFFPQFAQGKSATMTVGDLSSMASGLDWDESYYSPFSITTRAYFDTDLTSVILGLKGIDSPGKYYKYLSGNTQLLGMCIEKATGMSLADYVAQNFWNPMGAENPALWQTDHPDGIVKAYCCFASNARDFARFGKLYKQSGKWNGATLLDSTFIARSTKPRFVDSPEYGYGWWLCTYHDKKVFYMRGHLGQYVIVIPQDDLIIVRLGNRTQHSSTGNPHSDDFYVWLDESYKMLAQRK
ncbi:MAG: serine hydrolase [Bacteroidetes bacterium]|nr:serine hydrolase [Bacteroidota bacterium]